MDTGLTSEPQLINLTVDTDETNNLAEKYPEKLKEMQELLLHIKNSR